MPKETRQIKLISLTDIFVITFFQCTHGFTKWHYASDDDCACMAAWASLIKLFILVNDKGAQVKLPTFCNGNFKMWILLFVLFSILLSVAGFEPFILGLWVMCSTAVLQGWEYCFYQMESWPIHGWRFFCCKSPGTQSCWWCWRKLSLRSSVDQTSSLPEEGWQPTW